MCRTVERGETLLLWLSLLSSLFFALSSHITFKTAVIRNHVVENARSYSELLSLEFFASFHLTVRVLVDQVAFHKLCFCFWQLVKKLQSCFILLSSGLNPVCVSQEETWGLRYGQVKVTDWRVIWVFYNGLTAFINWFPVMTKGEKMVGISTVPIYGSH